ncbi:MAG: twin-arginine translocation pathway signal, partial [Albidovulum sp.]|nr:twin-arginine translocation pathway signal [Albidovulum sp.]
MTEITRRAFLAGTAACGGPGLAIAQSSSTVPSVRFRRIENQVKSALGFMTQRVPGTRDLLDRANGVLIMPLITKAGFTFGGAYGEGALQIRGVTVDYYSSLQATFGLQFGIQQYSHVLFFMTPEALEGFRLSSGWQ